MNFCTTITTAKQESELQRSGVSSSSRLHMLMKPFYSKSLAHLAPFTINKWKNNKFPYIQDRNYLL